MTAFPMTPIVCFLSGAILTGAYYKWNENLLREDDVDAENQNDYCEKEQLEIDVNSTDGEVLSLMRLFELYMHSRFKHRIEIPSRYIRYCHLFKNARSDQSRYLIAFRALLNISQKELARQLNTRHINISFWENDHAIAKFHAKILHDKYNLPLHRILRCKVKHDQTK